MNDTVSLLPEVDTFSRDLACGNGDRELLAASGEGDEAYLVNARRQPVALQRCGARDFFSVDPDIGPRLRIQRQVTVCRCGGSRRQGERHTRRQSRG